MFVVASESAEHLPFSSNNFSRYPGGVSARLKHPVPPHDEPSLACGPLYSSKLQAEAEPDSVRRKLCDSLTSALEMVVSKQLVKSVLGVVNDIEHGVQEKQSCLRAQFKTGDKALENANNFLGAVVKIADVEVPRFKQQSQSHGSVRTDVDFKCDSEPKEVEGDGTQARFVTVSAAKSDELAFVEMKESTIQGSVSEDGASGADELKGGLHLMDQAKKVAWNVEMNLLSFYGGVNKKYKEKARSLLFNLKDKSNPELRARVFNGEITPDFLVRMSAAQLASKELCQWRTAKAEEFASMVVLTDADVDPRRIVKKTHKGEFQVVVEENVFPVMADSVVAIRPTPPVIGEGREEGTGGGSVSTRGGTSPAKWKQLNNSSVDECQVVYQSSVLHENVENESTDLEEAADDFGSDLPKKISPDACLDDCVESSVQDGASETLENIPKESTSDKLWEYLLPNLSGTDLPKLNKTPTNRIAAVGGVDGAPISKKRERDGGASAWLGSIQLSATRFAPIRGFYKSGERLELKDWPQSVEVKGRVRLEALDKFLQDLQLSRSRTVSVLSLCSSDSRGDLKQMGACLKEMADHYRMGDRAGFVEPKPGFELYLLAPGSASLELLHDDLRSTRMACERDNEVLVGVVVWRKSHSQRLPPSRELDQNIRLKKLAMSNLVSKCLTKVSAKPLHWTETPSPGGALPPSLKVASLKVVLPASPSLVNVSGNSSIDSSVSHGDSSAACDHLLHRGQHHPSTGSNGLQLPTLVAPPSQVPEIADGALATSDPLLNASIDLLDVPPGFLPRTMQFISQARSTSLNVESKQLAERFQASSSFVGFVPGKTCMGPDGNREVSKDGAPGFWPRSSVTTPMAVTQRNQTAGLEEEDDLPEFHFDAEGVPPPATTNYFSASNQNTVLASHGQSFARQSFAELQHTSIPGHRYRGHHNIQDHHFSLIEFKPEFGGLRLRHVPQQEKSVAPRSVSLSPSIEGWDSAIRARETGHALLYHDVSSSVLPSSDADQRKLSLRAPREQLATQGEEFGKCGYRSEGVLGLQTSGPFCFQSSRSVFLNRAGTVSKSFHSKTDPPEKCPPSLLSQLGWPSVPISDHPLHVSQQLPLLHIGIQHQHPTVKNSGLNRTRGLPLPQQETPHNARQPIDASKLSEWQLSNSVERYYRSLDPSRILEQRESGNDKVHTSESNVQATRCSRGQMRGQESYRELNLDLCRDRQLQKFGSRGLTPNIGKTVTWVVEGNMEPSSELRLVKPAKREREREREWERDQ